MSATNAAQTEVPDRLLSALKGVYEKRHELSHWAEEEPVYPELLSKLVEDLSRAAYTINRPMNLGSTATVWELTDTRLGQQRALKLPRPRLSRMKSIVRAIRGERDTMVALNHQNVVKIFTAGDLSVRNDEYSFPYYVMEYLDGVQDLSDFIASSALTCPALTLVEYFRHILAGLDYLHGQGIVHCDIKPANILIAPGRQALITDFGYAKHFPRPGKPADLTEFTFTEEYAHPVLKQAIVDSAEKNATKAEIRKEELRKQFDLYALGKSMLETMRKHVLARRAVHDESLSAFTTYQREFMSIVAKRLLDGCVLGVDDDDLRSDLIAGLSAPVMEEIKYCTPADALADVEKLLDLYSLEGDVPELNPNISNYVQIPHCRVPLTPRVEAVINHGTFTRLAQISQLGFVSLVYPGASHTRFEHVLGTFAHCCEYVRALWHDRRNPLFQCLMTRHDIDVLLAAALLHDVGQFPMAHDFTEVSSEFIHETFGAQLMESGRPYVSDSLADVVFGNWGVRLDELTKVWNAGADSDFKSRVLKSVINGPLDCDKTDYLKRDSTHLGVTFGLALDHERLLRNMTVVFAPETRKSRPEKMEVVGLGVVEKALVVAEGMVTARQELFTQVYWHHTVRALKAMLGFAIRNTLMHLNSSEKTEAFWLAFRNEVLWLAGSRSQSEWIPQLSHENQDQEHEESWLGPAAFDGFRATSGLCPTDDNVLLVLRRFAPQRERDMIDAIRDRRLFKRLYVLTHSKEQQAFDAIYQRFYQYRLDGKLKELEDWRVDCERAIRDKVLAALSDTLKGRSSEDAREIELRIKSADPLILIDVPVKAVTRSIESESIWYIPEDIGGVKPQNAVNQLAIRPVALQQTPFDKAVGKIRLFSPPDLKDIMLSCITEHHDEITKILAH